MFTHYNMRHKLLIATNKHGRLSMNTQTSNTQHNGITTETFANSIGCKPGSIRVRLCETGSYFGVKPHKLPSGRLLWPADAVQQLIEGRAQ